MNHARAEARAYTHEEPTDDYRENLMRVIRAKLKGKPVSLEAAEQPREAAVVDLMERLRKSLEQHKGAKKAATKKRTRHAA